MAGRGPASVPFFGTSRPEKVLSDGVRLDGRGLEEFRNVYLKTGVVSQAPGSCYAEFGSTKVMVAAYGPRQGDRRLGFSEQGHVNCDVKLASFATRQRGKFGQSAEERELSAALQTALEPAVQLHTFPKAVLDVFCTILEAGGSELAATITAAALAVADAGVEMTDLPAACSVSRVDGALLLDPTADEAYQEEASLVVALCATNNELAQVVARGPWSSSQLKEGLELAMGGCVHLDAAMRQCLVEARAPPG